MYFSGKRILIALWVVDLLNCRGYSLRHYLNCFPPELCRLLLCQYLKVCLVDKSIFNITTGVIHLFPLISTSWELWYKKAQSYIWGKTGIYKHKIRKSLQYFPPSSTLPNKRHGRTWCHEECESPSGVQVPSPSLTELSHHSIAVCHFRMFSFTWSDLSGSSSTWGMALSPLPTTPVPGAGGERGAGPNSAQEHPARAAHTLWEHCPNHLRLSRTPRAAKRIQGKHVRMWMSWGHRSDLLPTHRPYSSGLEETQDLCWFWLVITFLHSSW